MKRELSEPWKSIYAERRNTIRSRLEEFTNVKTSEYFYELIFCILTPQSSQSNAEKVIAKLQRDGFFEQGFDPVDYLRNPSHYIRFHNKKSERLSYIRKNYESISAIIFMQSDPFLKRDVLVDAVPGFGLKEASHFLRNIGIFGLAILDRHILKHLRCLDVIDETPKSMTRNQYLTIEKRWKIFADEISIPIDELDLLFWSMETGEIKK